MPAPVPWCITAARGGAGWTMMMGVFTVTLALLPQQQRHFAAALPQLVRRHPVEDCGPHAPARIALSSSLAALLVVGGEPLSNRMLRSLPGSTVVWWNTAAANLLNHAESQPGPVVSVTPVAGQAPVWQVATAGGAPTAAWLAHPRTFSVLMHHVVEVTRRPVEFFAPTADEVFVSLTPGGSVWEGFTLGLPPQKLLTAAPVRFHHGYPVVQGVDRVPSLSAPHPSVLQQAPALTAA